MSDSKTNQQSSSGSSPIKVSSNSSSPKDNSSNYVQQSGTQGSTDGTQYQRCTMCTDQTPQTRARCVFGRFRCGYLDFKNNPSERPETKVDNDELKVIVKANSSQPTSELAAAFGTSQYAVLPSKSNVQVTLDRFGFINMQSSSSSGSSISIQSDSSVHSNCSGHLGNEDYFNPHSSTNTYNQPGPSNQTGFSNHTGPNHLYNSSEPNTLVYGQNIPNGQYGVPTQHIYFQKPGTSSDRNLPGFYYARAPACQESNIKKPKRLRTAFTCVQLMALEREYGKSNFLDRTRRLELSQQIHLNERVIKIWFQNRRMKQKKEKIESMEYGESSQSSDNSNLLQRAFVYPGVSNDYNQHFWMQSAPQNSQWNTMPHNYPIQEFPVQNQLLNKPQMHQSFCTVSYQSIPQQIFPQPPSQQLVSYQPQQPSQTAKHQPNQMNVDQWQMMPEPAVQLIASESSSNDNDIREKKSIVWALSYLKKNQEDEFKPL